MCGAAGALAAGFLALAALVLGGRGLSRTQRKTTLSPRHRRPRRPRARRLLGRRAPAWPPLPNAQPGPRPWPRPSPRNWPRVSDSEKPLCPRGLSTSSRLRRQSTASLRPWLAPRFPRCFWGPARQGKGVEGRASQRRGGRPIALSFTDDPEHTAVARGPVEVTRGAPRVGRPGATRRGLHAGAPAGRCGFRGSLQGALCRKGFKLKFPARF